MIAVRGTSFFAGELDTPMEVFVYRGEVAVSSGRRVMQLLQGDGVSGIESLKWMDPRSIAELIRNEHPQTIALIQSTSKLSAICGRRKRAQRMSALRLL